MTLQWLNELLGIGSGCVTSMLLADFVLLYVSIVVAYKLVLPATKNYRLGKILCKLCGTDPDCHWFFGHMQKYNFDEKGLLNIVNLTKTFRSKFCAWIGPVLPQVILFHPDTVIPLLAHDVPKSHLGYRFMRPWIGDGLLNSHGKKWLRNRRLLTPAFHYHILKPYLKIFNKCSKVLLSKWEKEAGNPVEVSEGISLMTLDTMLRCAMSFKTDCQNVEGGKHPYIEAIHHIAYVVILRIVVPLYQSDWVFYKTAEGKKFVKSLKVVHDEAERIIAKRQKALEEAEASGKLSHQEKILDFLDILLAAKDENGRGLTDREIRDEVDTFLFEGHDATASGISYLLYNLAKYPEYQENCREEILEAVGKKEDVEWDDLAKLHFSTMFIKESMRIHPPVPSIGRHLDDPLRLSKDATIPPNCNVWVHIMATHRSEHLWEEPEKFDPYRFTLENISERSSHAYIPFSAGPRNCIGQNFAMNEIKVVLCQVLRRYRLYLDHETPTPILKQRLVLRSENGIYVKFESLSTT